MTDVIGTPAQPTEISGSAADLTTIRRTLSLILLVLVTIGIYFAKEVMLPLLMGTLLALTLNPTVRAMGRLGLPPSASAFVLVLMLAGTVGGGSLLISTPISGWISDAPRFEALLTQRLRSITSSVAVMKQASDQVDKITGSTSDPTVQKVVVQTPGLLNLAISNATSVLVTSLVTLVLTLFLLASGDLFFVKLIDVFPRFGDKKRALRIVYGIERNVSRYILLVTIINAGLGAVIGAGMWLIGMPQPVVWAVVAFFVNFLPYIGPLFGAGLATAVAVVSFDHLGQAALAPAIYLGAVVIEGQFLTPVILGRSLELNTVSVFLTVIFWGWIWGIAGGLMAVPFLICLKVFCENVDHYAMLGRFLSAAPAETDTQGG